MPKVKFTSTDWLKTYHSIPKDYKDGDERDIEQIEADRLCKTYPDNFKLVGGKKAEPTKDLSDKSVSPEKNKDLPDGSPATDEKAPEKSPDKPKFKLGKKK